MKLAYSSLACPGWTIEEAVAAAVRYGYDAIEWRLADGAIITPETPPETIRRLRDVPATCGIEVACLDTSCQVVQATTAARAETLTTGRQMIDIANGLGSPFLRVFGGALPEGISRPAILTPTAEVLRALGEYAGERKVTIVLETHDAWTRSEDVLELLQSLSLPSVKILWDAHHTYRSGEDPAQTLARLGKAIAYVHLKDSQLDPTQPATWTYCLVNEGDVPLRSICAQLKEAGYDGYLSLEWEKKWHPEIAEPEIALPQAVPYLHEFWLESK